MTILRIRPEETYPLRQAVLRPGQPIEACVFPGDDAEETAHFGVITQFGAVPCGRIVGIASVYHESPPGEDHPDAWRLRGMAVEESLRRQGHGFALLQRCLWHAGRHGATMLWCNARTAAVPFYEKYGFVKRGEEFDIPGVGPHFFMWQKLGKPERTQD